MQLICSACTSHHSRCSANDNGNGNTASVVCGLVRVVLLGCACSAAASAATAAMTLATCGTGLLASLLPFACLASMQGGGAGAVQRLTRAAPVLAPLLAMDGAALLALTASAASPAALSPTALAAGGVLSVLVGIAAAHHASAGRGVAHVASAGDSAEVHVTVRNTAGATIDTSHGKAPLRVAVGAAAAQWGAANSSSSSSVNDSGGAVHPEETSSAHVPGAGSLSADGAAGTHRFALPHLGCALDAMLPGLVVGQTAAVSVPNPRMAEGGFVNPGVLLALLE